MEDTGIDLTPLLDAVLDQTGVSLHGYRASTIARRVATRLAKTGCKDHRQYLHMLADDPAEAQRLLSHLTIKVSRFFRNSPVFERLRNDILPKLLARTEGQSELRIWSAGCGNGEEAYSLAIALHELEAGRPGMVPATIFGTDVDEAALAAAREGRFPDAALSECPADLVDRYFTVQPSASQPLYQLRGELRDRVRFLRRDLLSESAAPDGESFQLVLCRNVLIYFDRPCQLRAFDHLAESLGTGGYLCLGEAEHLPAEQAHRFETVDRRARLYCRR